jgi:hypothetical protein
MAMNLEEEIPSHQLEGIGGPRRAIRRGPDGPARPEEGFPPMTNPRLGLSGPLTTPTKAAVIATAALLFQGCGPDMGPSPDQNAKNNPAVPKELPQVKNKGAGAPLKVMGRPTGKPAGSP